MRLLSSIVTVLAAAACAVEPDPGVEDGVDDAFTSADGKADGLALSEAEVLGVLALADRADEATLRGARVSARAARGLIAYRRGADGRAGTGDDQQFDSLAELDALPYVGPRALEALRDAAEADGLVRDDALGRHDVSILLPLPAAGADLPWAASTAGRGGPLLPAAVFARIGRSVFAGVDDAAEHAALRVVGVRFDPCFTTSLTAPCQPQLRLVFQALTVADGQASTFDGAVHALYNLTDAEGAEVTARLRALTTLAPENRAYAPLGVSPALAAQGLDGPYARALGDLIVGHAGASNLARMTFVTRTAARQGQWELGGFHVRARAETGFPSPGPIVIVDGATVQVVANAGFGGHRFEVTPGLADRRGQAGLDGSAIAALGASARKALVAWTHEHESPRATVPDTTDCTSCHIAGHVRNALAATDPALATVDAGPRALHGAERTGDNLRAFGYFFAEPHVSSRTGNETAAVVRALAAGE